MPSDFSTVKTINMPDSQASENQPKSFDSLEQQLHESFEQLGYPQLQAIKCSEADDHLELTGVLDSFYLKQVAQSVAAKIAGSLTVKNLIEVN